MHTLSNNLLTTNDRYHKQLPSPRIPHETTFKITKPASVVSSSKNSKRLKKKPALKIAVVKNNSHCNNIIIDHVKTVELIHGKICDPDAEKVGGNNNITFSTRKCCFATPKSATLITLKSATTTALNSLTKPFTPLPDQTSSTPSSPTTTFELNSGNNITNNVCRGAADVAPTNFGSLAGSAYNFNFFEVTDIVSPVNAAHEYSLKLGELLASFSSPNVHTTSVNTDNSKNTGPPVSAVPSPTSKSEQSLPSENVNSVSAMCITPARTHFLFSKIAGNLNQPTIYQEPDIPEVESKIPPQDSLLSTLPPPPALLEPECATEQLTMVFKPITENQESHQYQSHQHFQVDLPSYLMPIIIPQQQQQQQQTMARDFASLSSTPAYYNIQAHTTFLSPTFGVFPPHNHMQPINPEYDPLQAGSSPYPTSQNGNYFHEDQSVLVHHIQQVPYDHTYLSSMVVPEKETSYSPCYSSLSGSTSPCSSETYYESSIFSQNSPPTEDNYINNNEKEEEKSMLYAEPEKRNKKKKSRENKAWTNPMVEAGLHVSLMHENPLRVEKALPGKKGKYFCSHCKDQFRTILDLCEHMDAVSVRRPFHCPDTDCPWHVAGFPTASEWCRHTRFQHGRGADQDAQKLGCESCGKKFTRKDSLKRHYILVHENENSRYNSKLRKLEECRFKKKKKRQQQRQRQFTV